MKFLATLFFLFTFKTILEAIPSIPGFYGYMPKASEVVQMLELYTGEKDANFRALPTNYHNFHCHIYYVTAVEPQFLDMLKSTGQLKEFGRYFGIRDISLLQPSQGDSTKDPMQNSGLEFGDVILAPDQTEYSGINLTKSPASMWKNGRVPYFISFTDYNFTQRRIIENAIADFNTKVEKVHLASRTPFLDRDYVMIFNGNGCYSHLGKVGGQQALSLQVDKCLNSRVVEHEFMHAIGFVHEQNRPDRDEYIQLLPENILPDWLEQYEKVEPPNFEMIGSYDYYSIMHYPIAAPETGRPAFKILHKGLNESRIGKGDGVTPQDIEKLNIYYGRN